MHKTVKTRIDVHAGAYGWESSHAGRYIYEKDGYEIYFFAQNDGFELTIRNPETKERQTVFEVRADEISTASPLYVAILEHTLMNAERIVSRCSDD